MLLNSISSISFQDDLVPIFKCPQCPLMAAVSGLALDQNTVNAKPKFPFCSKCPSKKCKCFQQFQKTLEEAMDQDESADFYWKRERTERPEPSDHFLEIASKDDYFGFNVTHFEYPIKRDTSLRDKFVGRINGNMDVPGRIFPTLDPSAVCEKHGSVFNSCTEM